MTKYYFTRHGESEANLTRTFAGAAESPLTEKGRVDAEAEGRRVAMSGQKFDLIISSSLSRAKDTAAIIAAELEYLTQRIEVVHELHERDFGSLTGKPWDSIPSEALDFTEYGGESLGDFAKRVEVSLEKSLWSVAGENHRAYRWAWYVVSTSSNAISWQRSKRFFGSGGHTK